MRRVVKLGGSLLSRADLTNSFPRWLEKQSQAETLVVVGGGAVVDAIRELDSIRPGDPVQIHWQCVELLDVTFQFSASWFEWPVVADADQLRDAQRNGFSADTPTLVAVNAFYRRDACDGAHLPRNWQTTTDAIAASLACRVKADELILLKSCWVDPALSVVELASQGIVDAAFPSLASEIPRVRIEQLDV